MPKPPDRIRIAIMCRDYVFPFWQADVIKKLLEIPEVELTLLIGEKNYFPAAKSSEQDKNTIIRLVYNKIRVIKRRLLTKKFIPKNLLWKWYTANSGNLSSPPSEIPENLHEILKNVPVIIVKPFLKGKFSQYFSDEDIELIESYDLDIIIRFAFNIIRGDILNTATYGVWSFHHGDYLKYRGGPPGFWEVFNKDPESGAILQRLTEKLDDGLVLYEWKFKTDHSSYKRNKDLLFMGGTEWPAAVCRRILDGQAGNLFEKSIYSDASITKAPTNYQMLQFYIKQLGNKSENILSNLRQTHPVTDLWTIGVLKDNIQTHVNCNRPITPEWLPLPPGVFHADPFLITREGKHYLFFEEFDYQQKKGHISFIETIDFRNYSDPRPIIQRPFHLSYPFILEHKNELYCIPEQYQSGEVAIYQATSFPGKWEQIKVLLPDFPGVDPTLFYHEGMWWLFIANFEDEDQSKLYLFYADDFLGTWKPHKNNPVKTDQTKTRPAGSIFQSHNNLIRPAQNSTRTYGGGIIFNKIVKLTKDAYSEQYWGSLNPDPFSSYPDGIHHISSNGIYTVIDGKRLIPIKN
jgi:hypothetical protein